MKIKGNYVSKEDVVFCPSHYTAKEALELLEKSGYRNIPVINEKTNVYEGQLDDGVLYKHLYRTGGSANDNVLSVVTNKESVLQENMSIVSAIMNIDALSYLGVVGEKGEFKGIVTHKVIHELFRDGFGFNTGGYRIEVAVTESKGAIEKLAAIVKEFNIEGMHTFDNGSTHLRRISLTIPLDAEDKLDNLKEKFEKKGFRVVDIEKIEKL